MTRETRDSDIFAEGTESWEHGGQKMEKFHG